MPSPAVPRPGPAADYFEFGPFRLEVSARSLYRGEEFVPLTPKAFDLLQLLVEEAGRLVTKEEILARVWPDAFVEEGSIANNISLLRKVLNPFFAGDGPIATVARRGYRFVEPVHLRNTRAQIGVVSDSGKHDVARIAAALAAAEAARSTVAIPKDPGIAKVDEALHGTDPLLSPARAMVLVAVIVVIIGVIGVATAMRGAIQPPPPRRSVAVLPMKNLSGDASHAWLSSALSETISAELAGAHFRVVSGESVVRMQQEMQPPVGVGLTRKQLDDIGRDLACDLILTGNYLVVGDRVRVDVRLDEVATGEAIATATVTDTPQRFLEIVVRAGAELRTALRLDQQSSDDTDALRAAFSVDPDAMRGYFEGLQALRLRDGPRARDLLQASIEADDEFALAHAALSTTWRLLGYDARAAESAKRAFDLSSRLNVEDRMSVEAQYYEASGQYPRAMEAWERVWKAYPDNIEYGLKLANAQWLGGRPAEALATVAVLRRLPERDSRDTRIDLVEATAIEATGDPGPAAAVAARAAEKAKAGGATLMLARARVKQGIYAIRAGQLDQSQAFLDEAEVLFGKLGDTGGMADAVRWKASLAIDRGARDEGAALLQRAHDMVAPLNYIRMTALIEASQSLVARLAGDLRRSEALAASSLAKARESGDRSGQASALTALGVARRMQGDFASGRDAYEEAARIYEQIGEPRNRNTAINNSAVIDFLTGDLAAARAKWQQILAEDRTRNVPSGTALRLNNLSRVLALQDELAAAEQMNAEECRMQEGLKAAAGLAWCRTRHADLLLELGKRADAEALANQVTPAQFGSGALVPLYLARFARVQLTLGRVVSAAELIVAAEQMQKKVGPVNDQAVHVAVIHAEVDAAQGNRTEALSRVRRAIADADRLGLKTWSLDARLVLSRLDRREAAATEQAAKTAGFTLFARKASELRPSS